MVFSICPGEYLPGSRFGDTARRAWAEMVQVGHKVGGLRMREKEHLDLTEEERRILQALRDAVKGEALYELIALILAT